MSGPLSTAQRILVTKLAGGDSFDIITMTRQACLSRGWTVSRAEIQGMMDGLDLGRLVLQPEPDVGKRHAAIKRQFEYLREVYPYDPYGDRMA